MSIERPYIPSEEEYKGAQNSLTEEQQEMTRERDEALDNEVIEALCVKGRNSSEAMSTLTRWIEMKEAEAELIHTSKANVEAAICAASVYKRSGYSAEALAELEGMEDYAASQDDGFALYNKIQALKREITS